MEKGKYYYVWEEKNAFWMIGVCEEAPIKDPIRAVATFIASDREEMLVNSSWCFKYGKTRNYREATREEITWLNTCIRNGKKVEQPEEEEYEIY